jgi:RNA polymerase sigma-70 factor (ECF subfamily)
VSEATWSALKRLFIDEYPSFRRRLRDSLGSDDAASEALQDTFVRLSRGGEIGDNLDSPRGYLYQIAMNFARMRTRGEKRRLTHVDVDAVMEAIDDQPGPAEIAEAHSDMRLLERVLAEMPSRRRAIFIAAWLDNIPHRDIAARFGLSLRMIQIELKHASEQVTERFGKAQLIDFASRRDRSS